MRSIKDQCDHCRHFTGLCSRKDGSRIDLLGNERGQCREGIYYDDVRKQGRRMVALPCFPVEADNMPADGIWPTCPKQSFKSRAELEAYISEHMKKQTMVLPLIAKIKREHKGESWKGVEVCPVCGGKLHMSHASVNGHVWGQCETEGCLSWME